MIKNLEQYFQTEHRFYLNKIVYARIEQEQVGAIEYTVSGTDNITVSVEGTSGVTVLVTRKLHFEPESFFELEVSFGAELNFVEQKRDEIAWEEVDLAEEFKENGEFILQNIVSRISLLIAQITSSFGQIPLITPPGIPKEDE